MLVGFRKANGLTQKEVAVRLGVTQQTYARLEANPASVSVERLFRVLSVLGVEFILSSRVTDSNPIQKSDCMKKHDAALPARQEKW